MESVSPDPRITDWGQSAESAVQITDCKPWGGVNKSENFADIISGSSLNPAITHTGNEASVLIVTNQGPGIYANHSFNIV